MGPSELIVTLGERSYPIRIVSDQLEGLGEAVTAVSSSSRVVVVTDECVGPLWLEAATASLQRAGLRTTVVEIGVGEQQKSLATWAACLDRVLAAGIDRRTPIVALGGGIVGDVAGFVAAAVLRGVPFIQVPTTLLAMVDSSVGGKTGVNHAVGKNLIGAFHQPSLVYACLDTLETLPAREVRAGLGEVIKTALLESEDALVALERDAPALAALERDALGRWVARCAMFKAEVVAADELERGRRAILNLGHTIGHGLETELGHGTLLHGEAVAVGLVLETRWAVASGHCDDPALPARIAHLCARMGLSTSPPDVVPEALADRMRLDKKAIGDMLRVPVLARAGRPKLVVVSPRELARTLETP